MTATRETMRRLQAIRRVAGQYPLENADVRLSIIGEIATSAGDVAGYYAAEKKAATPIEPTEDAEPEKERKAKRGRDRIMKTTPNR